MNTDISRMFNSKKVKGHTVGRENFANVFKSNLAVAEKQNIYLETFILMTNLSMLRYNAIINEIPWSISILET